MTFELQESGYDLIDHEAEVPAKAKPRPELGFSGWVYRRAKAEHDKLQREVYQRGLEQEQMPLRWPTGSPTGTTITNPFAAAEPAPAKEGTDFDPPANSTSASCWH